MSVSVLLCATFVCISQNTKSTFVLENIFCEFDGTIYKQVTGFATGIKCGAEVGSLYLYAMERRFLRRYEQQTVLFKRFIDDGFVMWRGSEMELRSFLSQIYEGSGLQLTITISGERVIFLDMEIGRRKSTAKIC